MLRFVALLLAAASAQGAVWPEKFGGFTRKESPIPALDAHNPSVLKEFGFLAADRAEYASAAGKFHASAYQFRDSTGALAYFESRRPARARSSRAGETAVETPAELLLVHGNYVFRFDGRRPRAAELKGLFASLKNVDQTPLPVLRRYLPERGFVSNSQRYVLGPASLAEFEPRIPRDAAAFEFSTEAYVGKYRIPNGVEATLAVFSYPNAHISRSRLPEFRKIPGASVKRSGPLLAVVLGVDAATSGTAEKLLSEVNYQGEVTVSDLPPPIPQNPGNAGEMLTSIFSLAGLLLLLCLAGGILMGVFRIGGRQLFGKKSANEPMITLNLTDRENAMRSKG